MPLRTVRVPEAMDEAFAKAEEIVNRYFEQRKHDPEHGTIEIFGERYVLVRAASLSVEFFSLVEDLYGPGRTAEAQEFSRNILFDLAHSIGKSDAQNFHGKMGLSDPIARLSAGPIHFANTGWAFVDIFPQSKPSADESYYLIYDHPYSFESDAWLRAGKKTEAPVCIMNAGYSSGWCEESFGMELVAAEILCRARGDSCCRFIMAPPRKIEEHVREYSREGAPRGYEVRAYQVPDFFARKRMEEELRRARDDLEKRVEERTAQLRTEMAERAEVEKKLQHAQKLEAVGKLAGGIAHDFNNLLAVVMGNTALLAQRLRGDPSLERHFYAIQRAAERGAELTQQLLAFSRGQVRSWEARDVNAIVADLERLLSRVIGEDVKLVVALAPEPLHVKVGKGQLDQVLMNLVVNARDAMPAGGEIRIETARIEIGQEAVAGMSVVEPGSYVRLSISDTGVGMDSRTLGHVFEPFFTTKDDGRGTGLGLATVYGIVRQAGGDVSVESSPGRGSRFVIVLPWVPAPVPAESAPAGATKVPRGHESILLVEDQEPVRAVVAEILRDLGYTVFEADGPETSLALAAEHASKLDLVLTDVVLPRKSGVELARHLAAIRPGVKVLFMSGYPNRFSNADPEPELLLHKPFTPEKLARAVRDRLERP